MPKVRGRRSYGDIQMDHCSIYENFASLSNSHNPPTFFWSSLGLVECTQECGYDTPLWFRLRKLWLCVNFHNKTRRPKCCHSCTWGHTSIPRKQQYVHDTPLLPYLSCAPSLASKGESRYALTGFRFPFWFSVALVTCGQLVSVAQRFFAFPKACVSSTGSDGIHIA